MSKILLVAIATQIVFLIGEIPAAGYLKNEGFRVLSVYEPWFFVFTITRIIGIAGQIFLWSSAEIGRVSAIMGSLGIVLSNLLGTFLLHQGSLSITGYIGISFAIASILLLSL